MGSLALFELEETLGQTGDTVIIQMHEIGQKKLFRVFRVEAQGKDKPFWTIRFDCPGSFGQRGSDIQPIGSLELIKPLILRKPVNQKLDERSRRPADLAMPSGFVLLINTTQRN